MDYNNFTFSQRQGIASMLFKLAGADKSISPQELHFIDRVTTNLGLSLMELDDIRRNPDDFDLKPPPDEQGRMNIMYYLLFLCGSDGILGGKEMEVCKWMGVKLGFNPLMVEDMTAVLNVYKNEIVPPEELITIIKKYLN